MENLVFHNSNQSKEQKGERERKEKKLWINCDTYSTLAFPINEKSIFVHFECAGQLQFGVIFFLCPSVEYGAGQQGFRNRNLPIEFEFFRHFATVYCSGEHFAAKGR